MEELLNIVIEKGLGVASFILLVWFINKYDDKQDKMVDEYSKVIKDVSVILNQIQCNLSILNSRIEKLEKKGIDDDVK